MFDCADGWIILATGNDGQYRRLCGILDLADMAEAPAYLTNADRIANRVALTARITEATKRWSKADLLAACEAEGVPAGPINSLDEVFADPQVIARQLQIAPDGLPGVRSPMTFSGAELSLDRPAPIDWVLDAAPVAAPSRREQLRYTREHVVPWVRRRLTGRSSGDGRTAKYAEWTWVTPRS